MEKDTDKKFVRGLFLVVSWLMTVGPVGYAIATNQWIWLALIITAVVGSAVYLAVKQAAPPHKPY